MAHKKRRVLQHIMEDNSIDVLKQKLPAEWVLRKYNPDYGIDLSIELFKSIDGGNDKFDTLGEFLFAQLKSISNTKIERIDVYQRINVEHVPYSKDRNCEKSTIEVIKFEIDTNELLTVQAIGNGIPVLLILISLDLQKAYYVCLNDYIDKIIVHENPEFYEKESITIYIPTNNEILKDHDFLVPLRFYAKRPKLYAAFSKFIYQEHNLRYLLTLDPKSESEELLFSTDGLKTVLHYISIIKRFDFWNDTEMWGAIKLVNYEFVLVEALIIKKLAGIIITENDFNGLVKIDLSGFQNSGLMDIDDSNLFMHEFSEYQFVNSIIQTWEHLANLNNIFEEMCREWCLPTYLARIISYKNLEERDGDENA
jgi:hypothetical protein